MTLLGGRNNLPIDFPSSVASGIAIVKTAKAKATLQNLSSGDFFFKNKASPIYKPARIVYRKNPSVVVDSISRKNLGNMNVSPASKKRINDTGLFIT